MKRIILFLLLSLNVLAGTVSAQSGRASAKPKWVVIFDNGDMTIAYLSNISTNEAGNKIVWIRVNYHTFSDQLHFAKIIRSSIPVAITKTKAEYSFDYGMVMARQVLCYSKKGKLIFDSGDDTSAGWGYANSNDPLSIVAVHLLNKMNAEHQALDEMDDDHHFVHGSSRGSSDNFKKILIDSKTNKETGEAPITNEVSKTEETPEFEESKVFDVVEEMPQFPGGYAALLEYLAKNIQIPVDAEENGVQGRVICTFVVERDGSLGDIRVVKSVEPSLDQEAVRVIKSMPKWTPGKQNGSYVRVQYTVPVQFCLQ